MLLLIVETRHPVQAAPSDFDAVDRLLADAIASGNPGRAASLLKEAEENLAAVTRRDNLNRSGTNIDVISRSGLIDGMRIALRFDETGNALESVRAQTKALALVNSLKKAAAARQATQTPSLNGMADALYGRLTEAGGRDRNAPVAFTTPDADALIYRVVTRFERGLTAFELIGNPRQQTAVWEAKDFDVPKDGMLRIVDGSSIGVYAQKSLPKGGYPFYLLLNGSFIAQDPDTEDGFRQAIEPLLSKGIVPIVTTPPLERRPLTKLPVLQQDLSDRAPPPAALYYRPAGLEIWRSERLDRPRDLTAAVNLATAIVAEFAVDLSLKQPAPAGASLDELIPALRKQPEDGKRYEVAENVTAVRIDRNTEIPLTPAVELIQIAKFGDEWGQYRVGESNNVVWLRQRQIALRGTAPADSAAPAPGTKTPKPKSEASVEKQNWPYWHSPRSK